MIAKMMKASGKVRRDTLSILFARRLLASTSTVDVYGISAAKRRSRSDYSHISDVTITVRAIFTLDILIRTAIK